MKSFLVLALTIVSGAASAQFFSNTAPVSIPLVGSGGTSGTNAQSTVTSNLVVSGVSGTVVKVSVVLSGLTGTAPDDLDIMLVGPDGSRTILMSDVGGLNPVGGANLTIDDAAASGMPDSTALFTGTYRPTNFDSTDVWYNPDGTLQTAATTATLTTFNGLNPNGTWTLWARDDKAGDVHQLAGGWGLNLTVVPEPTTIAVLGVGALALARRRMKK